MDDTPEWIPIGRSDELGPGSLRGVQIGETWLAVTRLPSGELAAFDEWCTHEECQLSEGDIEGERVVCYCHSAAFDIRTGAVLSGPATEPIRVYELQDVDGALQVRIDAEGEVKWTEWRL